MPYSYLGNEGLVQGLTAGDAFFNCLGSTINEKTFCASGAERSIREGDPVRVYNDRGDFEGLARVTDDVRDGVIVATLGYWRSLNRSDGSVNSISSAEFCGLGRAPTFSDNLVQVVRVN
jgi:anaerobic selenocysteine-containing dehydrogenase